jgi:hypothetical protein
MTRLSPLSTLLAVLGAGAILTGCNASFSVGGDDGISADKIESAISAQYAEQNPGITLTRINCDDAEAEVGAPVACRGVNSRDVDLEFAGEVTDIDSDANRANYRWEVIRALAPGAIYEAAALELLRGQGLAVQSVSCPLRIEVVAGTRVNCEVTGQDGNSVTAVLELTDQSGGFRITQAPGTS